MSPLVRLLAVLAVALALAAAASANLRKPRWLRARDTRPEFWMNSVQLARRQGYGLDTHTFVTSDGYSIVLHRLIARNGTYGGMPVLMGHGLCSCDEQWLVRERGLAFQMADMGYDVWTVNYRGSFYSKKHKTLTVKDHDFWDFSFHENGVIDQAESIDYILKVTRMPDLIVIGHSMSSTAQVLLLADRPEYNDKVRGMVLLAPPAVFKHPTGFLAYGTNLLKVFPGGKQSNAENVENDVFSGLDRPFPQACYGNFGVQTRMTEYCKRILSFALGDMHEPVDQYAVKLIIHHYPAGTSIRQVAHYAQCITIGEFQKYDFGEDRNQDLYGQPHPPKYNISNIRKPVYIMYGVGDANVNWKDAETFGRSLNPGVLKALHRIAPKDWCHIDFLVAYDAQERVYDHVLKYLDQMRLEKYDD